MDNNELSKDYFAHLAEQLPPFIIRNEIHIKFGLIISSKTLANLDSLGLGPRERFKVGKNVAYPTKSLLEWLDKRVQGIKEKADV